MIAKPTSTATPTPADRDLRQRGLVPTELLAALHVTVIGVGAIGRQVALQLAAMGVGGLTLIDPDSVETHNLATQGFRESDLGRFKVLAVKDACRELNAKVDVTTHAGRFRRTDAVTPAVMCCVDSIETRRLIFESIRDRVRVFLDGRMHAETLRVLAAADEASREHYSTTLFAAGEAHRGSCTSRSTIYTANLAAALMVHQLTRWLRNVPIDADTQVNLFAGEWSVTAPATPSTPTTPGSPTATTAT